MTFHNRCTMRPNIKIWRVYLIPLLEAYSRLWLILCTKTKDMWVAQYLMKIFLFANTFSNDKTDLPRIRSSKY